MPIEAGIAFNIFWHLPHYKPERHLFVTLTGLGIVMSVLAMAKYFLYHTPHHCFGEGVEILGLFLIGCLAMILLWLRGVLKAEQEEEEAEAVA